MTECSLTSLRCTPCCGGIPPMTREEAEKRLNGIPGWDLDEAGTAISRRFSWKTFAEALAFANRVGAIAEEQGHHPTLTVGWGFCRVELKTHKIKGLHDNDFIMATLINGLSAGSGPG